MIRELQSLISRKRKPEKAQSKLPVFCSRPFKRFDVSFVNGPGSAFMCCTGWLSRQIGDLTRQSVEEIWNGEAAQDIRRSIHDGSFEYCSRIRCPYLMSASGPVQKREDVKDPELVRAMEQKLTALPNGPRELVFSYDRSCNLSCPSCRTEVIVDIAGKEQILAIEDALRTQALGDAHLLNITGSGDPFGSPYFRKLLQTMRPEEIPNLKMIHLQTNGLMWTPSMWATIPAGVRKYIKSAQISIDAATSETYAVNRRGGRFEKLLENLQFIQTLRQQGSLAWLGVGMAVQANNFREMPAFVRLGKQFGADTVLFSELENWGTYSDEEFKSRAVHYPDHPEHMEFKRLQDGAILRDPVVRKHFSAAKPRPAVLTQLMLPSPQPRNVGSRA